MENTQDTGTTARQLRRAWVMCEEGSPEAEAAARALAAHRAAHPEDKS
jgi:hypothetical protein